MDLWTKWQWQAVDRLKVEVAGRGSSLRKVDEAFPKGQGKRHKLQKKRGRPIPIGDLLEIMKVVGIDPRVFFAQLAGQGHPLEVAAIRGKRAPKWTKRQRQILAAVETIPERGSKGFAEAKAELSQLEFLRYEDPKAADTSAWTWLAREQRPGVVVGLLSFLAVAAPRSKAHRLLQLAVDTLGGQLRSAAGGRLATASGRCFIQAEMVEEGASILENFALSIAALYGDNDDQAVVLFQLAKAAAILGNSETNAAALEKAALIGSEHLRFAARQLLAYQELNVGDVQLASRMYDELVRLPQFEHEPKRSRISVSCSRMTARFLAGELTAASIDEFSALVGEARDVLAPEKFFSVVIDLAVFLLALGRDEDAKKVLEAELWNALDLEASEVREKFADLWLTLGLPRDTRFETLVDRTTAQSQ